MDDHYEYRHVSIPKDLAKSLPKDRLLSDIEWRNMGVQQSRGWEHYLLHRPEPHILLFRRPLGTVRITFFSYLIITLNSLGSSHWRG